MNNRKQRWFSRAFRSKRDSERNRADGSAQTTTTTDSNANTILSAKQNSSLGPTIAQPVIIGQNIAVALTHVGAGKPSVLHKNGKQQKQRRQTFGSRLSIHSLLFQPPGDKDPRYKSRSAHELEHPAQNWEVASTDDSGSDRESLTGWRECPLCFARKPPDNFVPLISCPHRSCSACMLQYVHMEILASRVHITCPECPVGMHPADIYKLLSESPQMIAKYEEFTLRRTLLADPDTRWCPAPDCSYAVIATGCAGCPVLKCERPGCNTYFCYHCKQEWHPNQTCDEARARRGSFLTSPIRVDSTINPGDIKACPRCRTYIVKMQDGSCNHMVCAMCGAEFCWLCMREISDLHYLSPSGCTFWGKKPWSRKKKLMWQLGTLIGAPVGIALIAGLAVPAIIFGVPIWVGRKVHQKTRNIRPVKHHLAVVGSVTVTVIMSPVLAALAVGVGVPIMLAYVYGVVPLSLCRNGTCGVTATTSGVKLDVEDEIFAMAGVVDVNQDRSALLKEFDKQDASTVTGLSMQSGSTQHRLQIHADVFPPRKRRMSAESGATSLGERINYEEASTKGLAGSTYYDDKSVRDVEGVSYCEEASTKALAGSIFPADAKSLGAKSICSEDASVKALAGSICEKQSLKGVETHLVQVETHFPQQALSNAVSFRSLSSYGKTSSKDDAVSHHHRDSLEIPLIHHDASSTSTSHNAHPSTSSGFSGHKLRYVDQLSIEETPTQDDFNLNSQASEKLARSNSASFHVAVCHDCRRALERGDHPVLMEDGPSREMGAPLNPWSEEAELLIMDSSKIKSGTHASFAPDILRKSRSYSVLMEKEPKEKRTSGSGWRASPKVSVSTISFGHRRRGSMAAPSRVWFGRRRQSSRYASLPDIEDASGLFSYSLSRLSQIWR